MKFKILSDVDVAFAVSCREMKGGHFKLHLKSPTGQPGWMQAGVKVSLRVRGSFKEQKTRRSETSPIDDIDEEYIYSDIASNFEKPQMIIQAV